jgi:glycine/D-amino acid oxidase-like deaminating enzyme
VTFPITDATPVGFADPLPEACDLVVVGGGVIGVCAALFAARRGLRVVLCEKGRIAGEQSSRNWGWIRQQGRDPDELPIVVEALRHWHTFQAETGGVLGLVASGVMYAARTPRDLARYEAWMPHARAHGVDTRLLGRAEITAMLPGAAVEHAGGLWTASDARAEPWAAVPALARLAQAAGVAVRESCAVRGLDVQAGRVAGVMTEHGHVRAPQVIVAAGAWSRLFLRPHGVAIPQLSVLASVTATDPVPGLFRGNFSDDGYAFRTRSDGGLTFAPGSEHDFFIGPDAFASLRPYLGTLRRDFRSTRFRLAAPAGYPDAWGTPRRWTAPSPFEACRILNPAPSRPALDRAHAAFRRAFPGAGPLRVRTAWAGMIDTMPDVVPVIDHVAALPGLIVATGMSGHGFGIGPGVGRVLADMAAGQPPGHDLRRFRLARFTDGSPIDPGPAL